MTEAEREAAIADVFAMIGGCAQSTKGGNVQSNRKKRYEPKTEFGRRLEAMVQEELQRVRDEARDS